MKLAMCLAKAISAFIIFLFINTLLTLSACKERDYDSSEGDSDGNSVAVDGTSLDMPVKLVASILPLKMILDELSKGRAEVHCFMKPGVSPHIFEPQPSDLSIVANAEVFYSLARILKDGQ